MVCDICKKTEATVHLTQIIDGKVLKVDLCEVCAKAKGVQEAVTGPLSDLLGGLGVGEETQAPGVNLRCETCGMTQEDFKKTGRLGCAECWETFAEGLATLLKAMHRSDRHVGKVPGKAVHTIVISEKIKELSGELQKAVHDEQYEQAAKLRDEIRGLESKLKTVGAAS
jgi:protein arginine kinase activator